MGSALLRPARASRPVRRTVAAGSMPPEMQQPWNRRDPFPGSRPPAVAEEHDTAGCFGRVRIRDGHGLIRLSPPGRIAYDEGPVQGNHLLRACAVGALCAGRTQQVRHDRFAARRRGTSVPGLVAASGSPRRESDEMAANFHHLTINGGAFHLAKHFGRPATIVFGGDRYLVLFPPSDMTEIRYPDMLIAFDADLEAYHRSNGYIISEPSKPPDFVLEIGSPFMGHVDTGAKRDDYAAFGIPEYWRFGETGRSYGACLAGDRLVAGVYRPVAIEELEEDIL